MRRVSPGRGQAGAGTPVMPRALWAGVATVALPAAPGGAMSGFVARTGPSTGLHDPLTLRALALDDTLIITADVVGLDEATCAAIQEQAALCGAQAVVHATHTHAGPASMPGRLSPGCSEQWVGDLVRAAALALSTARRRQRPAHLMGVYGPSPGVARNRRRHGGPVDDSLPVAVVANADAPLAVVMGYACHPVVLGADNTQLSADYPGAARARVEAAFPGCTALFLTGCAGDCNTGHSAAASITTAAQQGRTFAQCQRIGAQVGDAAIAGVHRAMSLLRDGWGLSTAAGARGRDANPAGPVRMAGARAELAVAVPGVAQLTRWLSQWSAELAGTGIQPGQRALLECWVTWAGRQLARRREAPTTPPAQQWPASVSRLDAGVVQWVFLPGEPFSATGMQIRAGFAHGGQSPVVFVSGYTDGCPGYIPPATEYAYGGYEVCEAYRYYGMPGPFACGAAEALERAATGLIGDGTCHG